MLEWSDFKTYISGRSIPVHEIKDTSQWLLVKCFDGPLHQECKIWKSSADYTDYVDNFQATSNPTNTDASGVPLTRSRAFANADNMRFRGTGISGTPTKTTTTNVDYKLTETRFLNGLELIVKDHVFGDSAKFQVVDVDNLLGYGAGLVLDEFGTDWYVAADVQRQGPYILPYPALINAGFYLRIVYNSIGTSTDVSLKINYFLHKKV